MMWFAGPWQHHGWFFGGGWAMGIGMIALIAIPVVLIVYLVRATAQTTAGTVTTPTVQAPSADLRQLATGAAPSETPREIVQRGYASGEIDRDEYPQKLADL